MSKLFALGPENKGEVAKKVVNLLAAEGVKIGDVSYVLSCVREITDLKLEMLFKTEKGKPVQPVD